MVENDGALIDSWHGILTENRMVLTLINLRYWALIVRAQPYSYEKWFRAGRHIRFEPIKPIRIARTHTQNIKRDTNHC